LRVAEFLKAVCFIAKEREEVMQGEIEQSEWVVYLNEFNKRNGGRAAHVEVIGEDVGAQEVVEKLPFDGITFENKGAQGPNVEIMLGASANQHLTHTISDVCRIVPKEGAGGREEALEIEAADGTKTLIVFEELVALPKATS
jgi:hypothetical protein